jgi:glycogen synthase
MVIVSRLTQQKGLPLMLHGIKVHRKLRGRHCHV